MELTNGATAVSVHKVTYSDGTVRAIKVLRAFPDGDDGPLRSRLADREELVSVLGKAIGAPVPEVARVAVDTLLIEWVHGEPAIRRHPDNGQPANDWYDFTEAIAETPAGVRLGLLDLLTANTDRNAGNWTITPDGPAGYDHDGAYGHGDRHPERVPWAKPSPLSTHFHGWSGEGDRAWKPNSLTPADVAWVQERLDAVRPAYERLGHAAWWEFSAARRARTLCGGVLCGGRTTGQRALCDPRIASCAGVAQRHRRRSGRDGKVPGGASDGRAQAGRA